MVLREAFGGGVGPCGGGCGWWGRGGEGAVVRGAAGTGGGGVGVGGWRASRGTDGGGRDGVGGGGHGGDGRAQRRCGRWEPAGMGGRWRTGDGPAALKLHHCATSIARTPSSPIAPGSPTGDLATAGARHLTADWPFQGPTGQIDPTSVTPYLRPCYATIPSIQNRTTGKEPPSGSMVTAGSHRRERTTLLPP
eukprot:XP_020393664.1 uncharacterized protein LOC103628417 [Zea mays]